MVEKGAVYEHVKTGKRYRVLAVARDSETLAEFVVYEALYNNPVSRYWIRPLENFTGEAIRPDGTVHTRFTKVGDS